MHPHDENTARDFQVTDIFEFEGEAIAIVLESSGESRLMKYEQNGSGEECFSPLDPEQTARILSAMEQNGMVAADDAPDPAVLAEAILPRMQGRLYRLGTADGGSFTAWPRLRFIHRQTHYLWLKDLSAQCPQCTNGFACFSCPHHVSSAVVQADPSGDAVMPVDEPDEDLLRSLEFVYLCELDGEFGVGDSDVFELFRDIDM